VDVRVFTFDLLFTKTAGSWRRVCYEVSCRNSWIKALVMYSKLLT